MRIRIKWVFWLAPMGLSLATNTNQFHVCLRCQEVWAVMEFLCELFCLVMVQCEWHCGHTVLIQRGTFGPDGDFKIAITQGVDEQEQARQT